MLVPWEELASITRPFRGVWGLTPNGVFSGPRVDNLKFGSCSQIVAPVATCSVPTSYVSLVQGVGATHGAVWVCFGVSPSNVMFSILSVDIMKFESCSQIMGPVATRSVAMRYVGPMGGVDIAHGAVCRVVHGFSL